MAQAPNIDGVLIQWGDRLFYPGNRIVPVRVQPKLKGQSAQQRAAAIRQRIEATVVRRAPQAMVKVTEGGRGMKAIKKVSTISEAIQDRCSSVPFGRTKPTKWCAICLQPHRPRRQHGRREHNCSASSPCCMTQGSSGRSNSSVRRRARKPGGAPSMCWSIV